METTGTTIEQTLDAIESGASGPVNDTAGDSATEPDAVPALIDVVMDEETGQPRGIVDIPLHAPKESKTGKTLMLGHFGGKTGIVHEGTGQEIKVQVLFYVDKPKAAQPGKRSVSF